MNSKFNYKLWSMALNEELTTEEICRLINYLTIRDNPYYCIYHSRNSGKTVIRHIIKKIEKQYIKQQIELRKMNFGRYIPEHLSVEKYIKVGMDKYTKGVMEAIYENGRKKGVW
jgi:hypothetical protein